MLLDDLYIVIVVTIVQIHLETVVDILKVYNRPLCKTISFNPIPKGILPFKIESFQILFFVEIIYGEGENCSFSAIFPFTKFISSKV